MKLGDKVSFTYGNSVGEGIIDSFNGGWVFVKVTRPLDMGFRVETDGVGLDPYQARSLKLIEAGPELSYDDVGTMPVSVGGGQYLKRAS